MLKVENLGDDSIRAENKVKTRRTKTKEDDDEKYTLSNFQFIDNIDPLFFQNKIASYNNYTY